MTVAKNLDGPMLRGDILARHADHDHRNQQYSITAVTGTTGTIRERYAYSAYGQPTILARPAPRCSAARRTATG